MVQEGEEWNNVSHSYWIYKQTTLMWNIDMPTLIQKNKLLWKHSNFRRLPRAYDLLAILLGLFEVI